MACFLGNWRPGRICSSVSARVSISDWVMLAALEPVHHDSPYVFDGIRTVDLAVRALFVFELPGRFAAQRLCDVVHQRLSVNLLFDRMGQLPAEALQIKAVFDEFERLFNAPTPAVKGCKFARQITILIQQRGGQHLPPPVGQAYPDQAQSHLPRLGKPQFEQPLARIGAQAMRLSHPVTLACWLRTRRTTSQPQSSIRTQNAMFRACSRANIHHAG